MRLDVRRFEAGAGLQKCSAFIGEGRRDAIAKQEAAQDRRNKPVDAQIAIERHRLDDLVNEADIDMVLQILADAGQVMRGLYAVRCKLVGVADAGQHENLRGIDRAGREDDLLIGAGAKALAILLIFHCKSAAALDDDALGQGVSGDGEIWPGENRTKESFRRAAPLAVPDREIIAAEAFLLLAVEIVIDRVAGLLARLDEQVEKRVLAARSANR